MGTRGGAGGDGRCGGEGRRGDEGRGRGQVRRRGERERGGKSGSREGRRGGEGRGRGEARRRGKRERVADLDLERGWETTLGFVCGREFPFFRQRGGEGERAAVGSGSGEEHSTALKARSA